MRHRAIQILIGFLRLVHFPASLVIGLMVFLPLILNGVDAWKALILALPFTAIPMFGFALNDLFDLEKDRINKPFRPLPSQLFSRTQTLLICAVLFSIVSIAIALAIFLEAPHAFYLIALTGVILYNYIVKYAAWLKTLMTALIAATPMLFIMAYLKVLDKNIFLAAAILLFINARELLMDIMDMKGDRLSQARTVPLLIGAGKAACLSLVAVAGSMALLFIHAFLFEKYIIFLVAACCSAACVLAWFEWRRDFAIKLMWIPMMLGIALIAK